MTPDQEQRIRKAKRRAWTYGVLAWVCWAVAKAVVYTFNDQVRQGLRSALNVRDPDMDTYMVIATWGVPVAIAVLFLGLMANQLGEIKRIRAEDVNSEPGSADVEVPRQ